MTRFDDDAMAVVARAVGDHVMTTGTLESLLVHVYWREPDVAAAMITAAYERGVIEEVGPGLVRLTEPYLHPASKP